MSGFILPSQNSEKPTALKGASLSVPRQENRAEDQKYFASHSQSDADAFKMIFM